MLHVRKRDASARSCNVIETESGSDWKGLKAGVSLAGAGDMQPRGLWRPNLVTALQTDRQTKQDTESKWNRGFVRPATVSNLAVGEEKKT